MSRFFSERFSSLTAYVPGEQPRERKYVKLNTNESPYPPSQGVLEAVAREAATLRLYSDPESTDLTRAVAERYGVPAEMVLMTNGSDEVLSFAFMAYGDAAHGFAFPDVSYGFYPVFAALHGVPYTEIALREDFTINADDYCGIRQNIVIANPNAPTGLVLSLPEIERIAASNPDNVVIIDEAYVDFGGESAIPLTKEHDNLLVTQTFSKSRSLAGARLGFGLGNPALIRDLNTIKYSINPYNVNRLSSAAGVAAIRDDEYYAANARRIAETREYAKAELIKRGFAATDSKTNFIFASPGFCTGRELYLGLKERGVLIRQWQKPRIENWCRITVGTREEMTALLAAIDEMKGDAPQS